VQPSAEEVAVVQSSEAVVMAPWAEVAPLWVAEAVPWVVAVADASPAAFAFRRLSSFSFLLPLSIGLERPE